MIDTKLRVAFFGDMLVEDLDGAMRTVFNLLGRIPDNDFEFLFFTGVPPKQPVKDFGVVKMPTVKLFFIKGYEMVLPQLAPKKMYKALDNFNPDIIHITSPSNLGNKALNYGIKNDIPVVSIYHTHFISYIPYYFKRKLALLKNWATRVALNQTKHFYERCTLTLYPTNEIVYDLNQMGVNTQNAMIWERGIDLNTFTPARYNKNYMRKITQNNKPNILFASRLVWEKNLETLIAIYNLAEKKGVDYNFIIAGDGTARVALEKAMPKAFFLGNISHSELATVYASSDVFVFPSISETFGSVVIEAMAAGLPCVVANGGGSRSFVSNGVNGYLCSPNNASEYLNNINHILKSPDIRNKFTANGLEYVKTFEWDRLAKRYFKKLKQLAGVPEPILVQ